MKTKLIMFALKNHNHSEELATFLKTNEIPKIINKPKTILEIAKQPHYENVISNIYAFYFDPNEVHKFQTLFITSLEKIISNKKQNKFFLGNDIEIKTEFPIGNKKNDKSGRIDLLLKSEDSVIIIENKIYHFLNNDLQNYWDSIDTEDKIGIVLSLKPTKINNKNFINITHTEFLDEVMNNLGRHILQANDKYIIFLKDLYQNIINMSNQINNDQISFYYEYLTEINRLVTLKKTVQQYIKNSVENACKALGLNLNKPRGNNEKRLRYYKSKKHSNLMLTVIFEELFTNQKNILIAIEIKGKLLEDKRKYKKIKFDEAEKEILNEDFYRGDENWAHFAKKTYKLQQREIENLNEFIINRIHSDYFNSVFKNLESYLSNTKKSH